MNIIKRIFRRKKSLRLDESEPGGIVAKLLADKKGWDEGVNSVLPERRLIKIVKKALKEK